MIHGTLRGPGAEPECAGGVRCPRLPRSRRPHLGPEGAEEVPALQGSEKNELRDDGSRGGCGVCSAPAITSAVKLHLNEFTLGQSLVAAVAPRLQRGGNYSWLFFKNKAQPPGGVLCLMQQRRWRAGAAQLSARASPGLWAAFGQTL